MWAKKPVKKEEKNLFSTFHKSSPHWSLHTWESATQWAIAGDTKRRPDLKSKNSLNGVQRRTVDINIPQDKRVAKKTDTKRDPDNELGLYFPQPLLAQLALISTNLVKSLPAALCLSHSHTPSVSAQKLYGFLTSF